MALTSAALTGLPLPKPAASLPEGLYVTESGPWWLEIKGSASTFIDGDDTQRGTNDDKLCLFDKKSRTAVVSDIPDDD